MKTTTILPTNLALLIIFLSLSLPAFCQSSKKNPANFYTGISPAILAKDGIEVNFLNSMSSFWLASKEYFPSTNSTRIANRYRLTRFQQLLRVNYGFSQSGRWDLGAELHYTHSRLDDNARSSPLKVLGGDSETGKSYRGISMLGVRVRMAPFDGLPELTLQGMAYFPMNKAEELRAQLGSQRTQVGLLATFFQQLNPSVFCFLQGDWRTFLANNELNKTTHGPSISGFLVFQAAETWYLFPGITYAPTLQASSSGPLHRVNQQLLGSIGALYQPADAFGIMLNYQAPFILESGSPSTEWVRESYTALTLGFRVLL